MAWYRAGGGGIPSSLKTDMNDVLNKKFGTSVDYPPTDWAPTVNLMGPLPEKTVSGSVVAFSDGADTVPLKKCEITLPASLDGYSSVYVVATGANLFTAELETGNIGTSGQDEPNAGRCRTHGFILIAPDTMCISYVSDKRFGCFWYDENQNFISFLSWQSAPRAITPPATAKYVRFSFETSIYPTNLMLNAGTTAETYEPYTAPTTHTADLGRTIYGGTADVVNGQGENGYGNIDMGTLTWQYDSANTRFFTVGLTSVIKRGTSGWITDLAVDSPYTVASGTQNDKTISEYASTGYVYIKDTDYTDPTAFKASLGGKYLTYPLATAETFTFDPVPIDSKLGNNTIWSEQGSAEVTYRADINLALGGQ